MGEGACRGVFARFASTAVHGGVDVHRYVVDRLACLGDLLHVFGVPVCLELLLTIYVGAEDLCPRALLCLQSVVCAFACAFRTVAFAESGYEFLGHLLLVCGIGEGREVACRLEHADFVLHLHHDYGVLAVVGGFEVLHESAEGALVSLQHVVGEAGGYLEGLARLGEAAREALGVGLEPRRGVAAHGVFPCSEPEEHYFEVVLACLGDDAVNEGEVEFALLGFDELPVCRHEDGVEPQFVHAWHHFVDVSDAGGGGVAQFAAEQEHRFAVDDELRSSALLLQLHLCVQTGGAEGQYK